MGAHSLPRMADLDEDTAIPQNELHLNYNQLAIEVPNQSLIKFHAKVHQWWKSYPRCPNHPWGTRTSISRLKAHKAPGPDGLTGKFFKLLKKEVSPSLTMLFNYFLEGTPIPEHMNTAYIKVLPKQDPTLLASNRPISLINMDLKFISMLLVEKLFI